MSDETERAEQDTPKGRILMVIPYVRAMIREAESKGTALGGIWAREGLGSKKGEMIGSFDIKALFDDIAALVGYQGDAKEEDAGLKVEQILSMLPNRGRE